jgi:signal transduction histidine kinase
MTSSASVDTAIRALRAGVSGYFVKPINAVEVLAELGKAVEMQRLVRENHALFEATRRELAERKSLERLILEVSENERRRIGRDLHDTLGQQLSGLMFVLDDIEEQLSTQSLPQAEAVAKASDLLERTIGQARMLAHGLNPPVFDDPLGLTKSIRQLVESIIDQYGIDCRFDCSGQVPIYVSSCAVHLYRIVQEAVSNAIRHGKANHIAVRLNRYDDRIELAVHDDGVGISDGAEDAQGMGLDIMKYRATVVGGALDVLPGEQGGTVVCCTLPSHLAAGEEGRNHGD